MFKTDEERKEYYAQYYAKKIKELKVLLGGRCTRCGTTRKLQFDHVDPKSKKFLISSFKDRKWQRTLKELKKCQLLCEKHHREKSASDGSQLINKPKGSGIASSKLTESQVYEIKFKEVGPYRLIAEKYGVSLCSIKFIRMNKTWKHVTRNYSAACSSMERAPVS